MDVLMLLIWSAGLVVFLAGLQSVLFFPLTIWYGIWKRRFFRRFPGPSTPSVSVIVPAYNEERMITRCLESILASAHPALQVIVVNDGSTDGTDGCVRPFLSDPRVRYIRKTNGGKASALNAGIAIATGEIVLFTDADSLFQPATIPKITRWFADPSIDAVCGDDTPLSPQTPLQKLLVITTHVGTGFVRRALSVVGVLPVISGNLGAVRKETLVRVGGFANVWGEDLDLTFRLHRAKARIVYDGEAMVACEVPRNLVSLWKQRVRWTRSYLKIAARHRDLFFSPSLAPFSFYLPLNWLSMVVLPLLQTVLLVTLPWALDSGRMRYTGVLDVLSWAGLITFAAIATYSTLIDRRPGDLRYIPMYGWLVLPFTFFLNGVVMYSITHEVMRKKEVWHKIERSEMPVSAERPGGARFPLFPSTAAVRVALGTLAMVVFLIPAGQQSSSPVTFFPAPVAITIATHFDAWSEPGDAISSVFDREQSRNIQTIAVGAGRLEWTFFRRRGHEEQWSNDQKRSPDDLLHMTVKRASQLGKGVVAIVDVFAPGYLARHPGVEAVGADGVPSTEQICFMELVRGQYGAELREMIASLVTSYGIEGVSLTELDYHRFCFDDRCLQSFREVTGLHDWPRTLLAREIDRDAPSIGRWRSALMMEYLLGIAQVVHAAGKKLYVDVPVDFANMQDEGLSHGLHYPSLLQCADKLVVWDYFYLDGRPPSTCRAVARFFTKRYGADRVILSIGLWGNGRPVSADEFALALRSSFEGGATQVWVTPNHLITPDHWLQLASIIGSGDSPLRSPLLHSGSPLPAGIGAGTPSSAL